jgi:hypothetical protein
MLHEGGGMTQVRVGLLYVLVAAAAGSAHAQTTQEPPWSITAEFLNVWILGSDVHVGDVFTEHQSLSGTVGRSRLDYGVTYDPIVTTLPSDQSVMVTAAYRGPVWQFGGRWWRATGEDDLSGSRSSAPPTATSQFLTGIRMWENSLIPVNDDKDPSGISPVTFHAGNRLEQSVIEGYAGLSWIKGPRLNLAARFGVAHSEFTNTRNEGQTQRAFVVDTSGNVTTTFTNNISIDSESETTASLTGPMIALAGDTVMGRVRIEWLVGNAIMIGTAATSGTWTDVDNIDQVTVVGGGAPTEAFTLLNGVIPYNLDDRAMVPVIELQVRGSVRLAKHVSVGAGVFSSTWFRLPVASAFVVPDDWTDLQGTGWRLQTRDVSFTGFSIFAGFSF